MKYDKFFRLTAGLLMVAGVVAAQQRIVPAEYIEQYKPYALESQELYGIPASIKMAQALLESDCGNSRLVREANNHFGIKCKREWTGPTILHDDDANDECFRRYASAEESFKDHSDFLDQSPRYQELFKLDPTDYKGWAYGLKAAGYATNPQYAEQLIKMIEDNQLYMLDRGEEPLLASAQPETAAAVPVETTPVEQPDAASRVDVDNYVVGQRLKGYTLYSNNGSQFVIASAGDTFDTLGKRIGVSARKLRKFNDLPPAAELRDGDMVYVKSKARRANNGKLIHLVQDGDTMHSIAQQYGIRVKNLANMNRRSVDARLMPGQQIRLM